MQDTHKTNTQLLDELRELRKRFIALETSSVHSKENIFAQFLKHPWMQLLSLTTMETLFSGTKRQQKSSGMRLKRYWVIQSLC